MAAATRATVMEAMVTMVAETKPNADGYWNTVSVIRV